MFLCCIVGAVMKLFLGIYFNAIYLKYLKMDGVICADAGSTP